MRYLSVCSGIEAASVAWHPLGWQPVAFSEVEAFSSAVLAHHYPDVPNWGDMTRWEEWPDADVDVLVGGTPCQSFSVAGLRGGLVDHRGGLALEFLQIARRYRPAWMVWENVPGVLSSDGGRDFGTFLGGLGELGYGFAYRVLDAQYVRVESHPRAVPQRRRRVFVVGHSDWRCAAAVLFEPESLSGHPAPRREARESAAPTLAARTRGHGGLGTDFDCDGGLVPSAAFAGSDREGKGPNSDADSGTLVATAFDARQSDVIEYGRRAGPLDTDGCSQAVVFTQNQRDEVRELDVAGRLPAIRRGDAKNETVLSALTVRRLTPLECERLQGFPDGYTAIEYRGKPAADGPRYRALGNSMAVNVMRWLGERIQFVTRLREEMAA